MNAFTISPDDYADIPTEMKCARRWLLWKAVPERRRAKHRKIPYYVDGGARTGPLDTPQDWARLVTFDEALAALQRGGYAGLGFALGPDAAGGFWQGVDLDDVPKRPGLQFLVHDLPGYTEASPSGLGVHAIGYGRQFRSLAANGSGIEAYAGGRYFTVTGQKAGIGAITCLASFVEGQLARVHDPRRTQGGTREKEPAAGPAHLGSLSAEVLTAELRDALRWIPADDYGLWVDTGHALKTLPEPIGKPLWLDWSRTSDQFDAAQAEEKWAGFHPTRTGYAAVFAVAQRRGWKNPRRSDANRAEAANAGSGLNDSDAAAQTTGGSSAMGSFANAHGPAGSEARGHEEAAPAKGERGNTQVQRLLDLASEASLFHTDDRTAFADIRVSGHRETWPVRSQGFGQWLTHRYALEFGGAPGREALKSALGAIEARAIFDGPELKVHVRAAWDEESIYIDLGDTSWRAIKVSAAGWDIISEPPLRFWRSKSMRPLPEPAAAVSINVLRRFVNVPSDNDFVLIVACCLAALAGRSPFPVLVLSGEQGAAKSTTTRFLRDLIDPAVAPIRALPRDERDLHITAGNNQVLAYDNVSHLPSWLSDAFCRLSTGGGFATRGLYTDREEALFDAVRPIILNGIEEFVTRHDLADRSISIVLPAIEDQDRQPEAELRRQFRAQAPHILGALLDGLAEGLKQFRATSLAKLPRMADFAHWATACETAFWPAGTFMAAYARNQENLDEILLGADAVASAIVDFMQEQDRWSGTASELLAALAQVADETVKSSDSWPKNPRALSGRLTRAAKTLRRFRIGVERSVVGHAKVKVVTLTVRDRPD
jgi:hypothetical protein